MSPARRPQELPDGPGGEREGSSRPPLGARRPAVRFRPRRYRVASRALLLMSNPLETVSRRVVRAKVERVSLCFDTKSHLMNS